MKYLAMWAGLQLSQTHWCTKYVASMHNNHLRHLKFNGLQLTQCFDFQKNAKNAKK